MLTIRGGDVVRPVRLLLGSMLLAGGLACSDSTGPAPSLIDTWALLRYVDHGITGVTSGTMAFRPDSTFEISASVTYPGEPTDSFDVSGTYRRGNGVVFLATASDSGTWDVQWTGSRYLLTLRGPLPTNQLVLGALP